MQPAPTPPPVLDRLQIERVASPAEEAVRFAAALAWADAALVIAPETDGILARRCRQVGEAGVASFNAAPEAIDLCGDKLRLYQRFAAADVPTPYTHTLGGAGGAIDEEGRLYVLKQRWGAGSQSMQLLSGTALNHLLHEGAFPTQEADGWLVQPYVAGRALSIAGLFDAAGSLRFLLPVAEQHLSGDGRFCYLGGRVPADGVDTDVLRPLVQRAAALIPGLRGYIGFDFVLPGGLQRPVLIEINPRLTSSYIGYRFLCAQPLTSWLNPRVMPRELPSLSGRVAFCSSGELLGGSAGEISGRALGEET